jgi:hypothetical protein
MTTLEHVQLPAADETASLPRLDLRDPWFAIAGTLLELRGRLMAVQGRWRRDDVTCALGWRLQLVGMHQRWRREDRATVEARLDDWFVRNAERLLRPSPLTPCEAHEPTHT